MVFGMFCGWLRKAVTLENSIVLKEWLQAEEKKSNCHVKYPWQPIQTQHRLRICKVIVLGDVNVGKTSIVNRFCRQVFNLNYKATIGVDFEVEQFDILNVPFNMQIWDTAGQERFRCIAAAYYRSAHVIITVFDLSSIKSLHHCLLWMNEALSSNIETPLKFLVGTKKDLLSDATYSHVENEAIRLARLMKAEYWAVSARTGENVRDLFYRIAVLSFERIIKSELETPDKKPQIELGQSLLGAPRKYQPRQKGCKSGRRSCLSE